MTLSALLVGSSCLIATPAMAAPSVVTTAFGTVVSAASAERNGTGIFTEGEPGSGGLDTDGRGISRQDLADQGVTGGAEVPFGNTGIVFTWPDEGQGQPDHWVPEGQVLDFEGTQASGISFLGFATNGASSGTAVVTYTDGSTQEIQLVLSDWVPGQVSPGNSRVINLTKRVSIDGVVESGRPVVFATAVAKLDQEKAVQSVTLPEATDGGKMHLFDVGLRPPVEDEEHTLPTRPATQEPTAPTFQEPSELDGQSVFDESTEWRFLDTGVDPSDPSDKTSWTRPGFDDGTWKTGTVSFGAKNGAIADLGGGYTPETLVEQYKPGTTTNVEAILFRSTFTLDAEQIAAAESLTGALAFDDAARLYVNGERVAGFDDARIDEGTGNMVYAGANNSAPQSRTFSVPASVLQEGENTIAVQVHNTNAGSSDIYMQLESLTLQAADAAPVVSDVVLTPGSDETARSLTFYTDRDFAGQVQIAPVSARTGEEFPESAATTLDTTTESTHDGRQSHKVTFEGLAEDTSYLYRMGNTETGWSRSYELWTGTYDDTYSYVFVGDPQIGASGSWQGDRDRWRVATEKFAQDEPDASFILSAGDQVEAHRNENEYASLLAPEVMQELPFAPTIGNHDNQSDAYNTHFNTPNRSETRGYESEGRAGGNYWYTFNDVLYLHLNSNSRSAGEQDHIDFVRETLEAQAEEPNWVVAVWHHSIYSAAFHSVDQDVIERRAALAPAMSELGVDLVLGGHDHIYTRSYLMDGTTPVGDLEAQEESGVTLYPEEGQVLYVAANSSTASKFYSIDDRSPAAAIKDQSNQAQYTDVDVSPDAITLTTYHTFDGRVVDQVTIARDAEAPVFDGVDNASVQQGEEFDPIAGVTATDNIDGDVTADIEVSGAVDVAAPGEYTLTYRVVDGAGNEATAERVITVEAVVPTFGGIAAELSAVEGEEFDPMAGVTATDANGADITDRVTVEIVAVETDADAVALRAAAGAPGRYDVIYSVTDDYGTTATATAVLTVTAAEEPGTDDPGTDDPGTDDPGTDNPGTPAGNGSDDTDGDLAETGTNLSPFAALGGVLALAAGAYLVIRRRLARD